MDLHTINKLNELNHAFYKKVGIEFDRTRQQYWEGWTKILPFIHELELEKNSLSFLDVACGNGRFGRFINEHLTQHQHQYHGLEREETLLEFSKTALATSHLQTQLTVVDIINTLLNNSLSLQLQPKYDCIALFGILHHIPSFELRHKLIALMLEHLNPGGLLIISSWQFARLPRFANRFISPTEVGIDAQQLEVNDYILDWQRGSIAYRYCHFAEATEITKLVGNSSTEAVASFYADGKNHQLNYYFVAKKYA